MYRLILLLAGLALSANLARSQTPNTVSIDTTTKAQTINGFGGSIAYFENWLVAHPNKTEVYTLLFSDLNLGILRLRNIYQNPASSILDFKEVVQRGNASLGRPVDVLLSTWSPPAALKANGITNGGTLLSSNGQFAYAGWAQWWYDTIQFYAQNGINLTYISMQNEPDFETTGWETCIFKNLPSASFPGYGVALQTLFTKLQGAPNRPKILGPEVTGVGFNNFPNYVDNLNRSLLDGYAYHLYNGGDSGNPDSYNVNLTPIKTSYADKPNMMTEYSGATWFNTAWLIQNCLVSANASAYLYWDLLWGRPFGTGGLISLESPWDQASWTTAKGYVINPHYYALKHFSKFISKGYSRIGSAVVNTNLRPTAFLSPDGAKLVVVLLNVASNAEITTLAFNGFPASAVTGVQSVENNYYYALGALSPSASFSLPARSVTTLEFTKGAPVAVTGVATTPSTATITVGGTTRLTTTVAPANATNKTVTWSSSNPAVATVDGAGTVTGVATGSATMTVRTQEGGKTAFSVIRVDPASPSACTFGLPLPTALPSGSASYSKVYVLGNGGPNLANVTNLTLTWDLPSSGLWQFSISTNDGRPAWWKDLKTVSTWRFNQVQPDLTLTNTGFPGLDGSYWIGLDQSSVVLVSKTRGFTLYFSNATTAPGCR